MYQQLFQYVTKSSVSHTIKVVVRYLNIYILYLFKNKSVFFNLILYIYICIYIYRHIYIYERETSVCMCYAITVKQKTQRLFDEFSYSFNT